MLLAEDNPFISQEVEQFLLSLGASDVLISSDVSKALRLIDANTIELAVLDIKLRDESCERLAYRCLDKGIPFIFATGYGRHDFDPKLFGNTPFVVKPYGAPQLVRAIEALAQPT